MSVEQEGTRIDVDLDSVDSPSATVPDGTYTLSIREANLKRSKETQRPMVEFVHTLQSPETGEMVFVRDYPLLDTQQGKFRVRQMRIAAGQDNNPNWTLENLPGASFQAELEIQPGEGTYPDSNRIRRVLVDVPKNRK